MNSTTMNIKKLRFLSIILIIAFLLVSCSSDDDSSNGSLNDGQFSARVDGALFEPDFVSGLSGNFISTLEQIIISADRNNGEGISINLPINITPDVYPLSGLQPLQQGFGAGYDPPNGEDGLLASSGTVTITSHDVENRRIIGTFKFVAEPFIILPGSPITIVDITEGSFDITYSPI